MDKPNSSKIEDLLMQIRILADAAKDTRSLVAIAAQFERDVKNMGAAPDYIKEAVQVRAHNRNDEQ